MSKKQLTEAITYLEDIGAISVAPAKNPERNIDDSVATTSSILDMNALSKQFGLREINRDEFFTSDSKRRPLKARNLDTLADGACNFPFEAWYQSLHRYRDKAGIYIDENILLEAGLQIGSYLKAEFPDYTERECDDMGIRIKLAFLIAHEAFHHQVESYVLRMLSADQENNCLYDRYQQNVYDPTYGTKDCLEESLANAYAIQRADKLGCLKTLPPEVREKVPVILESICKYAPPGYRECVHYLTPRKFKNGLTKLQAQIVEGRREPQRQLISSPDSGLFKPHLNCNEHVHLVRRVEDCNFGVFPTKPAN